jgi:HNH endonuclease/Domain of unknown function (DUF222)
MGQNAAGERVRVARALRELPETSAAFAAGQLSFTQVQAISRVATPQDEQSYIGRARRDRSQLTVQIDPISGWSRLLDGEFVPPGSLGVHDLGRRSRHPSQPLRDLLGAVDGERCRYPSCTRRRRLHAHHVIEWNDGGPTDLSNLALLCSRHHTLVHADGIRLKLNPTTRALIVITAAGRAVPHRPEWPWLPADELDPEAAIHPATLPPFAGDKLDLHYAVDVLMQHAA